MGGARNLQTETKSRRRPLSTAAAPNKLWNKIAPEYHMHMRQSGYYAAQYKLMKKLRAHVGGRILEVGCGCGEVAKYILANPNKSFDSYLGLDTSEAMIGLATRNIEDFALLTKRGNKPHKFEVGKSPTLPNRFDTVMAFNSFCYLNVPEFLTQAAQITTGFGKLIIGEEDPVMQGFMAQEANLAAALRKRVLIRLSEIRKIVEAGHFTFECEYHVPIDEKHELIGIVFGKRGT